MFTAPNCRYLATGDRIRFLFKIKLNSEWTGDEWSGLLKLPPEQGMTPSDDYITSKANCLLGRPTPAENEC
ncbi:hypothetical protein P5673_007998 [Acropora cervicornis]|uniref:Uncharacterized protein n=1 Tax=Acropora cervicornis TaxID=6130 RepID=A0AAD9QV12_ACRCE|nr:hypothetical protein P5673_007998 [Acropora cervicornis]